LYQDIIGYSKFSSVTTVLVKLHLSSFNIVVHNDNVAASFSHRLRCSTNPQTALSIMCVIVVLICNASLELFFFNVFCAFILFCLSSLF